MNHPLTTIPLSPPEDNSWTYLIVLSILSIIRPFFRLMYESIIVIDAHIALYIFFIYVLGIDRFGVLQGLQGLEVLGLWLEAWSPQWFIDLCDVEPLVERLERVWVRVERWRRERRW